MILYHAPTKRIRINFSNIFSLPFQRGKTLILSSESALKRKIQVPSDNGKTVNQKWYDSGFIWHTPGYYRTKGVENHLMKYATELEEKTMELDAMRTQLLDMNRDLDNRVRKRTAQIEELLRQKDELSRSLVMIENPAHAACRNITLHQKKDHGSGIRRTA
jgi:hypothetical protein